MPSPYFRRTWYVPFDRLIANTEAFIKDDPNNPHGYYTLARMHYFAFVNRTALRSRDRNRRVFPPNVCRRLAGHRDVVGGRLRLR